MTRKILGIISIAFFGISICIAQQNDSRASENRDALVCGSQLTVQLGTNVLAPGQTILLSARIKNSSTNYINVVEVNPATDFEISLTNNSGKVYKLTPDVKNTAVFSRISHKVSPGETYQCSVAVSIDYNIKLGSYRLVATRNILTDESSICKLTSNSLDVQVK